MSFYDKVWKFPGAGLKAAAYAQGAVSARGCGWLEIGHGPAHGWLLSMCQKRAPTNGLYPNSR